MIAGIALVLFQTFDSNDSVTRITLPGNVRGFSNIHIKTATAEDVKSAFALAEMAMNENVISYKNWNTISIFASWGSFFLGGVITLLAGYLGYSRTDHNSLESLQDSIKGRVRLSKIVGLIAAAATLMTGFSVKAKEEAETKRAKGIEIRDLIIASYKDIQHANAEEVTLILEKLKLQSSF